MFFARPLFHPLLRTNAGVVWRSLRSTNGGSASGVLGVRFVFLPVRHASDGKIVGNNSSNDKQSKAIFDPGRHDSLIGQVLSEQRQLPQTGFAKVVQTGKDVTYLAVIALCVAVTSFIGYTVFKELFSVNQPHAIYSKTLKLMVNDHRVLELLGGPVKAVSSGRGGRISGRARHHEFVENGKKHMIMSFKVRGTKKSGVVLLEMLENESGEYEYRYAICKTTQFPVEIVVLVDNRGVGSSTPSFDFQDDDE